MKKLIIFLILSAFLVVSCSSSKKSENDADILPDEDAADAGGNGKDEEAVEPDDEDEDKEKSDNDADTAEEEIVAKISSFAEICTGQTDCADGCPEKGDQLYGQDAQYAALGYCVPQSFSIDSSVENEPTVIDLNTGLEWQQTFSDAIDVCEASETSENAGEICENAENYCKNLKYGGHSDWRLPDIKELLSITNIAKYPAIDTAYFPGTPSGKFWTSSYFWQDDIRSGWGSQGAWTVNFSDGASNAEPLTLYSSGEILKHSGIRARCVRGKTLPGSQLIALTIGEEKIIVDAKTDFIWLSGYGTVSSWEEALPYCENLTYAGISDWRLPNKNELTSFFNYRLRYPSSGVNVFLSSTSSVNNYVWVVRFFGITPHIAERVEKHPFDEAFGVIHTYEVRCVAKSPCAEDEIWNGKKCVIQPCYSVKCPKDEHSTGECTVSGIDSYKCGCVEGWFWNGEKCENPCLKPCKDMPHSTGICSAKDWDKYICGCEEGYFWDGEKCMNPCDAEPCKNMPNTTGKCNAKDWNRYICECDAESFWSSSEECIDSCDPNPCDMPHSTGLCKRSSDNVSPICECEEGYFWNGINRGCVDPCETAKCDKPHTTGICTGKSVDEYYCECEGYYFWNPYSYSCITICETISCRNIPHATGDCTPISKTEFQCDCENGYNWNGEECLP